MSWLLSIAHCFIRAAHLLASSIVPQAFSPEPAPPESTALRALLAFVTLGGLLAAALRFRAGVKSREARIAAALFWVAVAVAIASALHYTGENAPLGRGVPLVALVVWSALAMTAAAAAERWGRWRYQRVIAGSIVLALGGAVFIDADTILGSDERMWREALRRDPDNERALTELSGPLLRAKKYDEARKMADRCVAVAPSSCACNELRAEAQILMRALDPAITDARAAVARCPDRASARAVLAEGLALRGDTDEAMKEAARGLELGGDQGRLRYVHALALERAGRHDEASVEVNRAIAVGAGRDARLLAAALAILEGDLDAATQRLAPLVESDPSDIDAQYNLALVADRKNDYNRARQGYIATLRLDPRHVGARYNVALLTSRAGAVDEARHHARKFIEAWPDDPRRAQLAATVGIPP